MPVSTQTPVISYTANGSVTSFAYPYRIIYASDLKVYLNGSQVISGFSVTGVDNPSGGNVVFTVAPANGVVVRLQRGVPLERTTDYVEGGQLAAQTMDNDFDRLVMMLQDNSNAPIIETPDGLWDAENKRIKNLADPVNALDAVNKQYYDGSVVPNLNSIISAGQTDINNTLALATTQANNASASATTATTQAGIATTQATNAAASAVTAATEAGTATTQAGISTTKAAEAAASAVLAASYSSGVLGGINTFTAANTFNSTVSVLDKLGVGGTPTNKLDVIGSGGTVSVNAAGDQISLSKAGYNYVTASGVGATLQLQSTNATGTITLATAGSERVRVDSSGNVGIGASPSASLDVYRATGSTTIRARSGSSIADLVADGTNAWLSTAGCTYFNLWHNGATRMIVDGTGNITQSTSTNAGLYKTVQNTNVGASAVAGLKTSSNDGNLWIITGSTANGGGSTIYSDNTSGTLTLKTYNALPLTFGTSNTERMRIDSSGNVGIGGTGSDKLNIRAASGSLFGSWNNGTINNIFGVDVSTAGIIGTTTNHPVAIYANNATRFQIGTAGQLGIGGATYGTSGQVLTSGGPSAAPAWQTINLSSYVPKDFGTGNAPIGLICNVACMAGSASAGGTIAGSNIYPVGGSGSLPGTWRNVGSNIIYNDGSNMSGGIAQRIA